MYLSGCANMPARFSQSDTDPYVARAGATGVKGQDWLYCYVSACLQANRLIPFTPVPSNCATGPVMTPGAVQTSRIGSTIGSVAKADPEPISRTILGFVAQVAGFLGAAHAQAVANEQQVICSVAQSYAQFADMVESGLQSGGLDLQDAITAMSNLHSQLVASVSSIAKPTNKANAGTGVKLALDALQLWNAEVVYPNLSKGLLGTLSTSPTGIIVVAGAGIVGAKILGVF